MLYVVNVHLDNSPGQIVLEPFGRLFINDLETWHQILLGEPEEKVLVGMLDRWCRTDSQVVLEIRPQGERCVRQYQSGRQSVGLGIWLGN